MNKPNNTHPQYDNMIKRWEKMRDTNGGLAVVQDKGSTYLPLLDGHTSDYNKEYLKYKKRAQFFSAVSRTVDTMAGHIFRKQPKIKLPPILDQYKADIDMMGTSLEGFIANAVREVTLMNRMGVLVEHPRAEDSENALTIEQSRQAGLRPYLTSYKAEDILNWKIERINNAMVLTSVYLSEKFKDKEGEEKKQVRQLALEGQYIQRIWREAKGEWFVHSEYEPKINGSPIGKIPFWTLGINEQGFAVQPPVLEGLADVCLGYYRNSADYEQLMHILGTATPWVNGVPDPDSFPDINLGPSTFLLLPPDAQVGMLQAGADGSAPLENALQNKKQEMAALGAQMLKEDKRVAESGNSLAIQRGGENSILASLAASVEMTMIDALRFMAEWAGGTPDDVMIELNKDYLPRPMDPQMLREWTSAHLSGAISFDTYFEGLLAGELVGEGMTPDDERDRKDMDGPSLPSLNEE